MRPLKPEEKSAILRTHPEAAPAALEGLVDEYQLLLAQRFSQDPELASSPAGARLAEEREGRLRQLFEFFSTPGAETTGFLEDRE